MIMYRCEDENTEVIRGLSGGCTMALERYRIRPPCIRNRSRDTIFWVVTLLCSD